MENKQIQIDLSKCDDVNCECGNGLFMQGFTLKRVPGLLIGKPNDDYVPVKQLVCTSCMQLFVQPDNKKKSFKDQIGDALKPKSKIEVVK